MWPSVCVLELGAGLWGPPAHCCLSFRAAAAAVLGAVCFPGFPFLSSVFASPSRPTQIPWLIVYIILTMVPHHVTTYYLLVAAQV